jgi:endoglucanase
VDELFALMKTQFVDKGIPLIVGEYGAQRRTNLTGDDLNLHLASRDHYLKYVTRKAIAYGLKPFYWDTGGVLSRSSNTVLDQRALDALIEGGSTE